MGHQHLPRPRHLGICRAQAADGFRRIAVRAPGGPLGAGQIAGGIIDGIGLGDNTKAALNKMSKNKTEEEKMALGLAESTELDGLYRLMKAVAASSRLIAEDLIREAGYMLPQSANAHNLLKELISKNPDGFPLDEAKKILDLIPCNESEPKKWVCEICGYVHEGANPPDSCPVCFQKVFKEQ